MRKNDERSTRLYHWLQAILFFALIASGFISNGYHIQLGLILFTLLIWRIIWRIIWGIIGE